MGTSVRETSAAVVFSGGGRERWYVEAARRGRGELRELGSGRGIFPPCERSMRLRLAKPRQVFGGRWARLLEARGAWREYILCNKIGNWKLFTTCAGKLDRLLSHGPLYFAIQDLLASWARVSSTRYTYRHTYMQCVSTFLGS
jgi:hypothetical protein